MKNLRTSIMLVLMWFLSYTVVALTDGDWEYIDNSDGTCNVKHYGGSDTEIVIPETLGGLVVTSTSSGVQYQSIFADNPFEYNYTITKVVLPDTLRDLGDDTFFLCHRLTHVYMNEGLTRIGIYALGECRRLKWVYIPETVTRIDMLAFFRLWSIKSIVIPQNVTYIGSSCFDQTFNNYVYTNYTTPEMIFEGNAPVWGDESFRYYTPEVYYNSGATGFTGSSPGYWDTIPAESWDVSESIAVQELPAAAFTLNVTNGSGSGVYTANELVTIKAETIPGKKFSYWGGSTYAQIEDRYSEETHCRMTSVTAVDVTAYYVFNPETAEHLVPGKVMDLDASELGLTQFTKRPSIYATYIDRYRSGKLTKTKLKVLTKISSKYVEESLEACWTKKVCLYSKKAFRDWYKSGKSAKDFTNQSEGYELTLSVKHRENGSTQEVTLDDPFSIVPPAITALGSESPVTLNDTVIVNGTDFGNKAPKVWLEYTDSKGQTKMLKCKVLKPYAYADVKGNPEKSCMDKDTGVSQITIQLPSKWPKDWVNGTTNLVLDNRIGMATIEITTQ